jgi:predicted ATPase/DNA-binding XRE family transcriptional regulator
MPRKRIAFTGPSAGGERPFWALALAVLREARALTQDGWALQLGVSRATVGRWESGRTPPDALSESALIDLCRRSGLLRRYTSGPLAGQDVTPEWLADLLADARLGGAGDPAEADVAGHAAAVAEPPARTQAVPQDRLTLDFDAGESEANLLKAPLTSLIDREHDIAQIIELVTTKRLVTLTGPGGVGKTRLAQAVATESHARFGDAVTLVSLAPIEHHRHVAAAIARSLDLRDASGRPLEASLKAYLRDGSRLLVLDNFEHVSDAAPLVADLLGACPDLRMLATSRSPLRTSGEQEFPVQPLAMPALDAVPPLAVVAGYPAVELFVARARAVRPDFALTDGNREAVVRICHRLDGLPLAIELAAARIKLLTPAELLARLESASGGLPMLRGGGRDVPARQQTLRDTICWSFDLLDDEQRAVFRRFAVFTGGCTVPTAEAVCATPWEPDSGVLAALEALVDHSLLQTDAGAGSEVRLRMLETVREFATEMLEVSGEAAAVRNAHLSWLQDLTRPALPATPGHDLGALMQEVAAEVDNIRAALSWALADTSAADGGLALAVALHGYWARAQVSEGCEWFGRLLASGAGAGTPMRARALFTVAQLLIYRGSPPAALPHIEECVGLCRSLGQTSVLVRALGLLAIVRRDDRAATLAVSREAVDLARASDDPGLLLRALFTLGSMAAWHGDLMLAVEASEEAVMWGECSSIRHMIGAPIRELGYVAYRRGDLFAARRHLDESLTLLGKIGNQAVAAPSLAGLGRVALAEGRPGEAVAHYQGIVQCSSDLAGARYLPLAISGLAAVACSQGEPELAVRLFGASEAAGEAVHWPLGELFAEEHTGLIARLRAELEPGAFDGLWAAGRAAPAEVLVAGAVKELTEPEQHS